MNSSKSRRRTGLVVAGALLVAAGVGIGTSVATGEDGTVTGTTASSSSLRLTAKNDTMYCSRGTATYALDPGAKTATGLSIGLVTGVAMTGCTGPGGGTLVVTPQGSWPVEARGGLAGGVGRVMVSEVYAKVTYAGNVCGFDVKGTLAATLSLNDRRLAVAAADNSLVASNVRGCSGHILNGDPISIVGTYSLQ